MDEPNGYRIASSSEAPNPLRPYYKPPTIGIPDIPINATIPGSPPLGPRRSATPSNRDIKEIFSDLDYGDYFSSSGGPSVAEMAKNLLDRTIWNYTSTLMAQPFEVAKVVLQCYDASAAIAQPQAQQIPEWKQDYSRENTTYEDSDSDDDAPSYFSPTTPDETPTKKVPRRITPSRSQSIISNSSLQSQTTSQYLTITNPDALLEVIGQLWSKEGAFGVWKGTNSTFVYGILLKTIETWTRSCLAAIFNISDPTVLSTSSSMMRVINGPNILDSPNPITSITVVVLAAGIAGFILSPIDMVRTRLLLTYKSSSPRALLPSLHALPSLSCPPQILPITILHSTLPSFITTSLPFAFRSFLSIDPILTPTTFSLSSFLIRTLDIFVKLPLETVLRRGHMAVLIAQSAGNKPRRQGLSPLLPTNSASIGLNAGSFKTLVPIGPYRGVLGTLKHIIYDEGVSSSIEPTVASDPRTRTSSSSQIHRSAKRSQLSQSPRDRRGQGWSGTVRGWRIGFWALIGVYATAGLSSTGSSEF